MVLAPTNSESPQAPGTALRIPIFPLNTVLFPGGLLPLRVFEARYMDMTRDCMKSGSPFGVCLIREGQEVGKPALPEPIGCLARITDWDMQQLGLLQLGTLGGERFRIIEHESNSKGLISANVVTIPAEARQPLPGEFAACAKVLQMVIADQGPGVFGEPHDFEDAAWVGNRLSEILPVSLPAKQRLLEITDSLTRLSILQRFLDQQGMART